jgi:voltage-gated potassium channel
MPDARCVGNSPLVFVLSFTLVVVVALAVAGAQFNALFFAIVVSASVAAVALQWLVPESRLLWIAFVNLIAVYASVFALFVDEAFGRIESGVLAVGFALPIAAFLVGCWWRRAEIRSAVNNQALRSERGVLGAILWLLPVWMVGAGVLTLAHVSEPVINTAYGLLVAMSIIGAIVLIVSREVVIFLVDAGLLFEEFFRRISHLVVPAFAFLTFYSLIVIIFAAVYRVMTAYGAEPHFRVGETVKQLSFPEALYFSVVTLSTVGYGDVVPVSSVARTLAALEVVLGVLLLLFGVSEILEYSRERRARRRGE